MRFATFVAVVAVCLIAVTPQALACDATYADGVYRGELGGGDLNDFAMILRSASQSGCQSLAASKLLSKLQGDDTRLSDWTGWQTGGAASMVLSAGLVLGAQGYLSPELDKEIVQVANSYQLVLQSSPACGFGASTWRNGNTCLEDYAIGMAAHGWRAAYYRLTGRDWSSARTSARSTMQSTLSSLTSCIHKPNDLTYNPYRGVCNGTTSDLTSGAGVLLSINKQAQSPSYGIGQMTALGAGFAGLEEAEEPIVPTEILGEHRTIAKHLWIEGAAHALGDGTWASKNDPDLSKRCVHYTFDPRIGTSGDTWLNPPWDCWDDENLVFGQHQDRYGTVTPYRADMFPVYEFMYKYGLTPDPLPTGWQFKTYFDRMWQTGPDARTKFWGPGRDVFYNVMPNLWFKGQRPVMAGRPDYLGGIKRGSYYIVNSSSGAPAATSTVRNSSVPDAYLTIVDLNYNGNLRLRNGDQVAIRNKDGRYWHATNGGGSSIWASVNYINSNTTFTIVKLTGDVNDPIAHNDSFALKAPNGVHYVTAPAGGTVTATATVPSTNETLKLERLTSD
jgi:hypothetical protein